MMSSTSIVISVVALAVALAIFWLCARRHRDRGLRLLLEGQALLEHSEAVEKMEFELDRARRHDRRLIVAHLQVLGKDPSRLNVRGGLLGQISYLTVGSILRRELRQYDIVSSHLAWKGFTVLLPECDKHRAQTSLSRIAERIGLLSGLQLQWGLAEFPTEGFILSDLLSKADANCFPRKMAVIRGSRRSESSRNAG